MRVETLPCRIQGAYGLTGPFLLGREESLFWMLNF